MRGKDRGKDCSRVPNQKKAKSSLKSFSFKDNVRTNNISSTFILLLHVKYKNNASLQFPFILHWLRSTGGENADS